MDNQNENWLDDILGKKQESDEIQPDEQAVASAGLTHPDELDLERIIEEAIAENWNSDLDQPKDTSSDATDTQFFNPQRGQVEPAQSMPATPKAAAPKKLPPKKKRFYSLFGIPHILSTVIWAALILFIGITLGRTVWLCAEDLLALGKTGQEVTITIEDSDTLADVANKLQTAGMIRYASLFETFAKVTGKGDGIDPGPVTFSDTTVYDYNALIYAMSYDNDPTGTVEVTIPEGYTCAQIFKLLEEKGVCSVAGLEEYAANGELDDYWFLEGVKRGSRYCLEGYLFPDTYQFYLDDEPENAIEKLLDGFDYRFSDLMKEKLDNLNKTYGTSFKLKDIVNMASMVQKEKATDLEGYTIASVFYNRLTHAASFPLLNCDSTILYAVEAFGLATDAQINASPYNTYTQPGLPAGPICNPGLSSLDAALEPEDSKYYYFVLDKETNRHVFSKTYDEHQRWLNKLGY